MAPTSPEEPNASALHHQRIRTQHAREIAQDYVEAIAGLSESDQQARVTDLARHFGVSHVTVIRTIGRLQEQGLVHTEPYKAISLTKAGARMAEESRQRHETVVNFLVQLGVSPQTAEADAEGIEHHVSPETLQAMKAFIAQ